MKEQIRDVLSHSGDYSPEKAEIERERKTTFEELRDSTKLPDQEKALDRLTEECWVMLILWSPVPAKAISQIVYHVMKHPEKLVSYVLSQLESSSNVVPDLQGFAQSSSH